MKKVLYLRGMLLAFVFVAVGDGSPVDTVAPRTAEVSPFSYLLESHVFAGRQRALVIAIGTGRAAMGLYVFDSHGNCVVRDDDGSAATKDDLAVEWYPPHTQRYAIELRNLGQAVNQVKLIVR